MPALTIIQPECPRRNQSIKKLFAEQNGEEIHGYSLIE